MPSSPRRARHLLALTSATSLAASLALLTLPSPAAAAVTDPCLRPVLRQVAVSQGLPSYPRLARGKTTLVKLSLSTPACLPTGATITVTDGSLTVSPSVPDGVPAVIPLGGGGAQLGVVKPQPLAPSTTAPVPNSPGDPLFVVPGSVMTAPGTARFTMTFSASLTFVVTRSGTSSSDTMTISSGLDGKPIGATVDRPANPLRILVVPMSYDGVPTSQYFPDAAATALHRGMLTLGRLAPLPDGVANLGDAVDAGNLPAAGLRYAVSSGRITVPNRPSDGMFCGGAPGTWAGIQSQLAAYLQSWNSANEIAVRADRVLGVVWQGVSRGTTTDAGSTCYEGQGLLGLTSAAGPAKVLSGSVAWVRLTGADTQPAGTLGSIAALELMHTLGGATALLDATGRPTVDPRPVPRLTGPHSTLLNADETAPRQAYNLSLATSGDATNGFLDDPRSVMDFTPLTPTGRQNWTDAKTLLEKDDWTYFQCETTPAPDLAPAPGTPGGGECLSPGSAGSVSAAAADQPSYFLSGTTDGTSAGTQASSEYVPDKGYEPTDATSDYRLVELSGSGVLSDQGIAVHDSDSTHSGADANNTEAQGFVSFATRVPASATLGQPQATRIELRKRNADGSTTLLYARDNTGAPVFVGVPSVNSTAVTLTAHDAHPDLLRLDVLAACPGRNDPLVVHALPVPSSVNQSTGTAAFVVPYDSSRTCPSPTMTLRLGNGFQTASTSGGPFSGAGTPRAAVLAPAPGAASTTYATVALVGQARDAAGDPLPSLDWYVTGPAYPTRTFVGRGSKVDLTPPTTGLPAGRYTVTLEASNSSGPPVTSASSAFDVALDTDGDRLSDARELDLACFGTGAVTDPNTPNLDADNDGLTNGYDGGPCTSALNLTVVAEQRTLDRTTDKGEFELQLSGSPVDLRTLATPLAVTQIAGYAVSFAPTLIEHPTATALHLEFDRAAINAFLRAKDLTGYVPFYVTSGSLLRGNDPRYPIVK